MVVEAIAAIVHNLRMLGVEDHVLDIVHLDVPIRIHGVPMDSKQSITVRLLRRLQLVIEVQREQTMLCIEVLARQVHSRRANRSMCFELAVSMVWQWM